MDPKNITIETLDRIGRSNPAFAFELVCDAGLGWIGDALRAKGVRMTPTARYLMQTTTSPRLNTSKEDTILLTIRQIGALRVVLSQPYYIKILPYKQREYNYPDIPWYWYSNSDKHIESLREHFNILLDQSSYSKQIQSAIEESARYDIISFRLLYNKYKNELNPTPAFIEAMDNQNMEAFRILREHLKLNVLHDDVIRYFISSVDNHDQLRLFLNNWDNYEDAYREAIRTKYEIATTGKPSLKESSLAVIQKEYKQTYARAMAPIVHKLLAETRDTSKNAITWRARAIEGILNQEDADIKLFIIVGIRSAMIEMVKHIYDRIEEHPLVLYFIQMQRIFATKMIPRYVKIYTFLLERLLAHSILKIHKIVLKLMKRSYSISDVIVIRLLFDEAKVKQGFDMDDFSYHIKYAHFYLEHRYEIDRYETIIRILEKEPTDVSGLPKVQGLDYRLRKWGAHLIF